MDREIRLTEILSEFFENMLSAESSDPSRMDSAKQEAYDQAITDIEEELDD